MFEKLKAKVNAIDPKVKETGKEIAKGMAKGVVITLAIIGGVFVVATIDGMIQQKLDPEGFEQQWLAEMEELGLTKEESSTEM